jgi:polyphosphate kinase
VAPAHLAEIDELFELGMSDETSSWWLDADGTWIRNSRASDGSLLADLQDTVYQRTLRRRRPGALR